MRPEPPQPLRPRPAAARGSRVRVDCLVTDLDRTFTTPQLALDEAAVRAAQRLRGLGVRVLLATGRGMRVLSDRPALTRAFDGFVLEGGAVWGRPGDWRVGAADARPVQQAAQAVLSRGVQVRRRRASFSMAARDEGALRGVPGLEGCSVQRNRDRLDVVPAGVDKGTGIRGWLAEWQLPAGARVAGIGDGENDVPLLAACTYRVAVANAVPELVAMAHEVTPEAASRGFAWLVRERLAGPEPKPAEAAWAS